MRGSIPLVKLVLQVTGRLHRVTCPLCNLSHDFLVLATISQSMLVLHGVFCPATCLTMLEKNPLQVCRSHVTRCNLELQLAIVSKRSM